MNLTDLQTFIRVVDHGTLAGAAAELGVPRSTVSRRVTRLEAALGVELLRRAGRAFTISPDGQALHDRVSPALMQIREARTALVEGAAEPRGRLTLTATIDFSTTRLFAQLLAGARRRLPEVQIALLATNRFVDLLEENVDVAFRMVGGNAPLRAGLMMRRLGGSAAEVFAAPDYLARRGVPETPADLAEHDLLVNSVAPMAERWPLTHRASGQTVEVPVSRPVFVANDFAPLTELVAAGGGIALLPRFLAVERQACGDLARVLPGWEMVGGSMALVWLRSRHLQPKLRGFIDHTVATLAALPGDAW